MNGCVLGQNEFYVAVGYTSTTIASSVFTVERKIVKILFSSQNANGAITITGQGLNQLT